MKIAHQPHPMDLWMHEWSCASYALAVLLNQSVSSITQRLIALRQRSNWNHSTIRRNLTWMYDYEIRHFMRPYTRKTRCIVPQKTLRVHQLAHRVKKDDVVFVMIHMHVMIIHQNKIWDANGCNRDAEGTFGNSKIYWYQHCKL